MASRGCIAGVLAVAWLGLMGTPQALAAPAGEIVGGTADSSWTAGHVDDLRLTYEGCADGPSCSWRAIAAVVPDEQACPAQWQESKRAIWASAAQTGQATVSSGPRDFTMDGTEGQRVCLMLVTGFTDTSWGQTAQVTSKLLALHQQPPPPDGHGGGQQPPPPQEPPPGPPASQQTATAPPPPPAKISRSTAKSEVRKALGKRFGRRWSKGRGRSVRCAAPTAASTRCTVRFTYKGRRYQGAALVTRAGQALAVKLSVTRRAAA